MAAIRAPSFGSGLRVAVDKTPALFSLEVRAYCLRGLGFTHRQDSRMGYRGASSTGLSKQTVAITRTSEPFDTDDSSGFATLEFAANFISQRIAGLGQFLQDFYRHRRLILADDAQHGSPDPGVQILFAEQPSQRVQGVVFIN